MLFKRIILYIRRWIKKRRILRLHKKYDLQFKHLKKKKRLTIDTIHDLHRRKQVEDYIACIDFRLYFISQFLSPGTANEVNRYKEKYRRKQDFRKISDLIDVIYLNDVRSIEIKLTNLTREDKRRWVLWK